MIRQRRAAQPADSGSDAIARILRAEQDAEHALERVRARGEALIADARRRALEIQRRADDRVTRLNVLCAQRTAQRSEELRAAELAEEALSLRPVPKQALDEAVTRVADWLLGGSEP